MSASPEPYHVVGLAYEGFGMQPSARLSHGADEVREVEPWLRTPPWCA